MLFRSEARRAEPQNDLISILTQAFDEGALAKEHKAIQGLTEEQLEAKRVRDEETHGAHLSDDELLGFLTVLLVAGNETTRNAISGGLLALSLFPEQRRMMVDNLDIDDFMDCAVDELVRFVSPVLGFIRTVTTDHTYRNTDLHEGDRVLMLYASANRDDDVFDTPNQLDLQRDPNPHLAFGIGPHFCLGANLARREITVAFEELHRQLPDIAAVEEPDRLQSAFIHGIKRLPVSWTPLG